MLSIFLLPLAYILLHLLDHQYSTVDVHSFVHFGSNREKGSLESAFICFFGYRKTIDGYVKLNG